MDAIKAYLIEGGTHAVSARFATLKSSQLDQGDVEINVRYSSVNFKDALAATGRGTIIRRFPCVGGIDAVGTVRASDSPRFKPGDSVIVHSHGFGTSQHGGFATRTRAPADWVNLIPAGLSELEAISLGVAGYTAALAVDLMELNGLAPPSGRVLVNGATGGVAGFSIDMLAGRGYHVVAVTSKPEHEPYLKTLGAREVITPADLTPATKPLEKSHWAGAVDSLGGAPLAALTRTMKPNGVIAALGNAAGHDIGTTVMPFILRGLRLIGVWSDNDPATREHIWHRLATDLRPRHLESMVRVRPFEALPEVIDDVIEGRNRGRNVIAVDASQR